jgi:hypothetical protein
VCKRWPSLFGRCTLLSTDHSRAGDVANALSEACRYRRPSDAPILWSDLVPLLARQFAREEADGYHGIIRHAAPALRSDVERLTAEHQALLAELERLVSFTRQWAREEFFWAVNRFAALLDAHEQREARLMRNFLLVPAFDA